MVKADDREMERLEEETRDHESRAEVGDQLNQVLEENQIALPDLLGNYSEQTGAIFG